MSNNQGKMHNGKADSLQTPEGQHPTNNQQKTGEKDYKKDKKIHQEQKDTDGKKGRINCREKMKNHIYQTHWGK